MKNDDRLFAIICSTAMLITVAIFLAVNGSSIIAARSSPAGVTEPTTAPAVETVTVPATGGRTEAPSDIVHASFSEPLPEPTPDERSAAPGQDMDSLAEAISAVAQGETPSLMLAELPSMAEVLVRRDDDNRLVVAAGTHRRYADVVRAIAAIDPQAAAEAYGGMKRAVNASDDEAPMADADLDLQLGAAIDHLLAVHVPEVEPDMCSTGAEWAFVDGEHEQLSAAQKHLLLMGRRNARTVQAKLVELKLALGWVDAARPRDTRLARSEIPSAAAAVGRAAQSSGEEVAAP